METACVGKPHSENSLMYFMCLLNSIFGKHSLQCVHCLYSSQQWLSAFTCQICEVYTFLPWVIIFFVSLYLRLIQIM